MSNYSILKSKTDITELEELAIKDGLIVPVSYEVLRCFTQEQVSLFCHKHAIYQFPTTELIDFLRAEIESPEDAMEIGAGNGCVGRALKIRMTDSKMQDRPDVKAVYMATGQPTIKYGADVEELDAIAAVEKHRPKIVVACWVTHKYEDGMRTGNMYGIDERQLFANGVTKYIHVGNDRTHLEKPILKMPHQRLKFPWLVSRSMQREDNVIYLFDKR